MDANYIEGFVRVPLSQFISEDNRRAATSIHISDFEGILQNSKHRLTGHIDQRIQARLLNVLKLTAGEFRSTTSSATIPSIAGQDIHCAVNGDVLQAAKTHGLDDSFECIVQICCLPPPQFKKFSDGEIFQNVRHFAKQQRYNIAQRWIDVLSAPKRRHLTFMLDRPLIMDSLDRLLCYPGLWAGLQLGNWAKHLAAHIDECIIYYLNYINSSYEQIFRGHEDLKHLLDESTVYQLQNLTPAWSESDRLNIQKMFRQRIIFTSIKSEEILTKLEQNILSFTRIIPSIQTFHQNMKYLTIGAKILEKYIEVKPAAVKKGEITRTKPTLFDNLSRDWVADKAAESLQINHEKFIAPEEPSAMLSFTQLLIAALRYFPLLSIEAPLQDFDGEWEALLVSDDYIKLLCQIASQLGFNNEKIKKQAGNVQIKHRQYEKPPARMEWRSGKPPFYSFALLFNQSFTLRLFGKPFKQSTFPSALCIQSDILRAFLGLKGEIRALGLDADMDDVEEVVHPGMSLDVQKTVARHIKNTKNNRVPRKTIPQQTTLGPKPIGKNQRPNRQKTTQLNTTEDIDEEMNTTEDTDEEMNTTEDTDEEMNQTEETNQEPQRQQGVIEEIPIPKVAIPRLRAFELDDDDDDGDNSVIRKRPKRSSAKRLKNYRKKSPRSRWGEFRPHAGENSRPSQTANRSESSPPIETSNAPFNNPTEALIQTTSTKQTTQTPINAANASQGISRSTAEAVVSRESTPEMPQVASNRIAPLYNYYDTETEL